MISGFRGTTVVAGEASFEAETNAVSADRLRVAGLRPREDEEVVDVAVVVAAEAVLATVGLTVEIEATSRPLEIEMVSLKPAGATATTTFGASTVDFGWVGATGSSDTTRTMGRELVPLIVFGSGKIRIVDSLTASTCSTESCSKADFVADRI